jgi:microcin C transport system substrate-binding protein
MITTGALGGLAKIPILKGVAQAASSYNGDSTVSANNIEKNHGISLGLPLEYPAGYHRFSYVNPDAPKGGGVYIAVVGKFNSFNSFITKGVSINLSAFIYDTLMVSSYDEASSVYGLLAHTVSTPSDKSWCAFSLNPQARWWDGSPITARDVVWTFNTLVTQGKPQYSLYYQDVEEVIAQEDHLVVFRFKRLGNRELPYIASQLPVLPEHWWQGQDFSKSQLTPTPGSGPYIIDSFEINKYVKLVRNPKYWASRLPCRVGMHNFNTIQFDFFSDDTAAFQAFKSGNITFRDENSSSIWANGYDFPAIKKGTIIRKEVYLERPKSVQFFAMNLRRKKFQKSLTRKALTLAFDFEWINKVIFFGQYARPQSYAQGAQKLMALDIPKGKELQLLESYRKVLPPELFSEPFALPVTDGTGNNRKNIREAQKLLKDAGWHAGKSGELMDEDGNAFTIDFLSAQPLQERVFAPFIDNLKKLGIRARLTFVDSSQYVRMLQDGNFNFDVVVHSVSNSETPGYEQYQYWGSESASQPGGWNISGVTDPVIDAVIDTIVGGENHDDIAAAARALDRILLWNYYTIPELYTPYKRIAYADDLGFPDPLPPRNIGFPQVWWNKNADGNIVR